ncbi:MAG TPA: glutaminyl-peptide cyclotransferase [Candidatus Sulfotelmatobacter sp.]|nr:glutaminyl-peptide cyclotransferase [Candidatus Sulfotelmatobacter sp.]
MKKRLAGSGIAAVVLLSTSVLSQSPSSSSKSHPPEYTFEVVRQLPHDSAAFTQGFTFFNGFFYEGTGRQGQSSLRQVDPETGRVTRKVDLAPDLFGEGVAVLEHTVVQLTWTSHIGFVYDLSDFHLLRTFQYSGEGWGLATDGRDLYMSDGSSQIRVLDGRTFAEKRRINVHDSAKPVEQLNELEFVEGELYANIWHSDRIARISPHTGEVTGWIDLTGILGPFYQRDAESVLNGIAYDSKGKRVFVTGKLWPRIFEIRVVPKHAH